MASIETRPRANGTESYRLTWRYGGKRDGAKQSATYPDGGDAKRMKGAIEALGHLVYAEDPRVKSFELVTGMKSVTFTASTFGDVAEKYVVSRTAANARTRTQYRTAISGRLSALQNRPIEAVTDDEIRELLNKITDAGGSTTAVHKLLGGVFKHATNKGMLPNGNPMRHVQAPKKRGRVGVFLTELEARWLLDACRASDPVVGAALADLVNVFLGSGLRHGEALGLIVDDVHVSDVYNAWIDVRLQLSDDMPLRRVELKSGASARRVAVDLYTAKVFARLVKGKRPNEPVFTDPKRGGWWRESRVRDAWYKARSLAQQRNGLAKLPRIHDLRHTHAAWLLTKGLARGVGIVAVQQQLGHENIKTTIDTYGWLLPEAGKGIRAALTDCRKAMAAKPTRAVRQAA